MKRVLYIFVGILSVSVASEKILCPKNEVWSDCGSACPITCEKPVRDTDLVCPAVCKVGCVCAEGYLRNKNGTCVKKELCKEQKCPKNEIWNECISACPRTCEKPVLDPEVACPAVCKIGCDCAPGYLRNKDGDCVKEESCVKCGKNAVFNSCASACPKTCEYPDPRPCIKICVAKCDCIQGYVWDNSTKSCVKLLSCPKKCADHEFWNECGSNCGRSCQYPSGNPNIACPAVCVPKCDCDYGYLRNDDGKCVPAKSCAKCPKNEFWNDCASACPLTCKNKKPEACIEICESRCDCEKGFVRNDKGLCVEPKNC